MGYWYGNTDERADSWHWIGVAISLSQTLGLHRDPGESAISISQRRLWRRIWWCCFYRDRYIALGMGRPTRINLEDCDVPDLVLDDMDSSSSLLDVSVSAACTIQKCQELSPIFLEMLQLCKLIGRILACQYRPRRSTSSAEVQDLHSELQSWYSRMDSPCRLDGMSLSSGRASKSDSVVKHFLHITYQ